MRGTFLRTEMPPQQGTHGLRSLADGGMSGDSVGVARTAPVNSRPPCPIRSTRSTKLAKPAPRRSCRAPNRCRARGTPQESAQPATLSAPPTLPRVPAGTAEGGNRTPTPLPGKRILNPSRLPVPPLRLDFDRSLERLSLPSAAPAGHATRGNSAMMAPRGREVNWGDMTWGRGPSSAVELHTVP